MGQAQSSNNNNNNRHSEQTINNANSEIDSLNWNDFNTDDIESVVRDKASVRYTVPTNVQSILNNLNVPTVSTTESDAFIAQPSNINYGQKFNNLDSVSDINGNESSPFISSEMYKFVMQGGADSGLVQHGRGDDPSSTTSTSDTDSDMVAKKGSKTNKKSANVVKSKKVNKSANVVNKASKKSAMPKKEETTEMTEASYISSSDGETDTNEDDEDSSPMKHHNKHADKTDDDDHDDDDNDDDDHDDDDHDDDDHDDEDEDDDDDDDDDDQSGGRVASSSLNTSDINLISLKQ